MQTWPLPGGLDDAPFAWRWRGDEVVVTHRGLRATVLRGEAAAAFLDRVSALDEAGEQELMARLTGNFKRGNERH